MYDEEEKKKTGLRLTPKEVSILYFILSEYDDSTEQELLSGEREVFQRLADRLTLNENDEHITGYEVEE